LRFSHFSGRNSLDLTPQLAPDVPNLTPETAVAGWRGGGVANGYTQLPQADSFGSGPDLSKFLEVAMDALRECSFGPGEHVHTHADMAASLRRSSAAAFSGIGAGSFAAAAGSGRALQMIGE
jgi:hypothetical protein